MAALAKQWSSGALDRAEKLRTSIITNGRSLARAASTRSARAPESHLNAPEGEGCLPSRYDAVFPFQRLGIKLVLATRDGRAGVFVHEVVDGVCPPDVLPHDEVLAVDGARVGVVSPDAFDAFVRGVANRARPLTLTLRPGEDRVAAAAAQRRRLARLRSPAALKTYEARERDGRAAYNASMLRANGVGGAEDRAAALLLLRKSAALGVVRAQVALARLYLQGSGGVKKDDDEAFRWFAAAAESRDADALFELGRCHRRGIGCRVDLAAGRWCFDAAVSAGGGKAEAAEATRRAKEARDALDATAERRARVAAVVDSVKAAVTPRERGALYDSLASSRDATPFETEDASPFRDDPDYMDPDYVPPAPAHRYQPPALTPPTVFEGRKTVVDAAADEVDGTFV